MAMQATHIRFAKELELQLEVKDRIAYYSGAIYPDSRYTTGVDRLVTHKNRELVELFENGLTDFEKGWMSHLLYDWYQEETLRRIFNIQGEIKFNEKAYLQISAAKFIEELKSTEARQICNLFSLLESPEPINGETKEQLDKWYDIQKKFYLQYPDELDDFNQLQDVANKFPFKAVINLAKEMSEDEDLVQSIHSIYDQVLSKIA